MYDTCTSTVLGSHIWSGIILVFTATWIKSVCVTADDGDGGVHQAVFNVLNTLLQCKILT